MSFSGIRTLDDLSNRVFHFQRVLLENTPESRCEDPMAKIDATLSKFQLGLLNYPYRNDGQNGTTVIFKLPSNTHGTDRFLPISLRDIANKEDYPVYTSVSTVMDFFSDYFGLEGDPMSYRNIRRKKYKEIFPFGYLSETDIPDFTTLVMRAAHNIFMNLGLFETDNFYCIKINIAWNSLETITIEGDQEIELSSRHF